MSINIVVSIHKPPSDILTHRNLTIGFVCNGHELVLLYLRDLHTQEIAIPRIAFESRRSYDFIFNHSCQCSTF